MEIIICHQSADFDSLAAMVAAKKIYKDALLVFPGSVEKNVRKFISIYGNLIKITPLRNIKIQDVTKLIIVDTRVKRRIGSLAGILKKRDVEIHIYDHHPATENDIKGKTNTVEEVGAATTILLKKIKKMNIEITPIEATLFALGIYEDTGSLTFSNTTIDDIDCISYLFKKGIKLKVLNNFMNIGLDKDQKELMNQLLHSDREIVCKGVRVIIAKAEIKNYTEGLAFLTHKIMEIENSDAFFTLVKMGENIYIVGRSRVSSVDVDEILKEMGGGGHSQAASAVVKKLKMEEVDKKLVTVLEKKIVSGVTAINIMSSPVKTVNISNSIEETRKISLRYGHNGIPVVEQEELKGIITMQELNRAKRHGFGKEPVSKYMSKQIIRAKPNTPLIKIQELMVSHNIGRILVLDKDDKLVGIVTRSDLISNLYGKNNIAKRSFSTYIESSNKIEKNKQEKLIREIFPKKIQNILHKIGKTGDKLNFPVFMVGGVVRDLFLKIKNYDLDIAVEGEGIKYAQELCKKLKGRIKSYKKFNTAVIILPDGFKIDIATARREFYEYPAALPRVELSSIKKDLYRRDFTINAMAIQLNKKNFGKLIDFFGGKKDLQLRIIRVLYNLSFVEDPARIIRAIRFEQRYNFKMDSSTEYFLKKAVNDKLLSKLRKKRTKEELMLILNEEKPERALVRMEELGVLKYILPGIKIDKEKVKRLEKVRRYYKYWENNIFTENIELWIIYFICLLDELEFDKIQRLCKRMMIDNKYIDKINYIFLNFNKISELLSEKRKLLNSEIYTKLNKLSNEMLFFIMMKSQKRIVQERITKYLNEFKREKLFISGKDIKKLRIKPGPIYAKLLNKLLYAQLDDIVRTKEDEMKFIIDILKKKGIKENKC
ncbi:MAG: CBS domain-containing protein [Candidatus Caldatribacteriota bacterium]|nr:CBS domain-containing protein [Candidatus Caldatribacteriota bacterium]